MSENVINPGEIWFDDGMAFYVGSVGSMDWQGDSHPRQNEPKPEGCEGFAPYIKVAGLARAYVPNQVMCEPFPHLKALRKGTAFPELYSQYK